MENKSVFSVEVCFITPDQQFLRSLQVPQGTTLQQAIELSGLLQAFPDLNLDEVKVGIYSKIKVLDTLLKDRDRVEVYRPLQVDPMVARRARAFKKKSGN